jgi:uncharacterized protein (TIGR02265 family)
MSNVPTIKGIFVNSHIKALRRAKGEEGLESLRKECPDFLNFKNSEDVPVRDEVRLLECVTQIIYSDRTFSRDELEYEAGRQHFQNFLTTPFARILLPLIRTQFKGVMLGTGHIAGHVFKGVEFSSEDKGEKQIIVRMQNNDYPILHFKGFFQEWLNFSGLEGKVEATELKDTIYEYRMHWS